MKCQNCGKTNSSFHYTANVNGNVTEVHLCHECADKLGYSNNVYLDTGSIFDSMLGGFFGRSPALSPFGGAYMLRRMPMTGYEHSPQGECCGGEECRSRVSEAGSAHQPKSVNELCRRREINVLKEQMRVAAQDEDFEKAAELRDRIKKLELGE